MKIFSIFLIVLICFSALLISGSSAEYEPFQCFGNGKNRACRCLAENGDVLAPLSHELKHCECILAKNVAEKAKRPLIPKCSSNGDYEALQCFKTKKPACQCWSPDGDILTQPSFELKHCECILARKEAEKNKRPLVPECQTNGQYAPLQCQKTMKKHVCQCLNPNGDVLTSLSFKLRNCTCILAKKAGKDVSCEEDGSFKRTDYSAILKQLF